MIAAVGTACNALLVLWRACSRLPGISRHAPEPPWIQPRAATIDDAAPDRAELSYRRGRAA